MSTLRGREGFGKKWCITNKLHRAIHRTPLPISVVDAPEYHSVGVTPKGLIQKWSRYRTDRTQVEHSTHPATIVDDLAPRSSSLRSRSPLVTVTESFLFATVGFLPMTSFLPSRRQCFLSRDGFSLLEGGFSFHNLMICFLLG